MIATILLWWVVAQLPGLAVLPLAQRVFRSLPGAAFAFGKTAGLLVVSYLVWLGAITGLWSSKLDGITMALLLTGAASMAVLAAQGLADWRLRWRTYWHSQWAQILTGELLFTLCFFAWAIVRAYTPDKILPAGGEKYMEIAFLNGVLNSPRFPPLDPWLSGFAISYYYFGYVMMAIMTRMTGVLPTVAFDLYDALLFALSAQCAYGVVAQLVSASGGSGRASRLTGALGAALVVGMGNLEGLLEGLYSARALPETFFRWLRVPGLLENTPSGSFYPGDGWWWWHASRVIEDLNLQHLPASVQPINEFPFFSFLLGDNHPHKLALPFVLLCIGLSLALYQSSWRAGRVFDAWIAGALALGVGALGFLNTWDMPVALALTGLVILFGARPGDRFGWQNTRRAAVFVLRLGAGALALYVFFYLGFDSQAGGVLPYIFPPTRLAQFLIMFGPFIWILACFLFAALRSANLGRFPWRRVLRTWLWVVGISLGGYLLVVLASAALVGRLNTELLSSLQSFLNGYTLAQVPARVIADRLANPWLLLLATGLLALALALLTQPLPSDEPLLLPRIRPDPQAHGYTQGIEHAPLRFAVLLALLGLALTLAVEFFYLRDNFGARMNTLFKFYFQAWGLMACASAYAIWWGAARMRQSSGVFLTGAALLLAAGFVYPLMATWSRAEGFRRPPSLDAAASVSGFYAGHWAAQPDDWAAITWINQTIRPTGANPLILEAPGGAYEQSSRVSAFTGLPGLLGWQNHEGQWRGSYEEQNRRLVDIEQIYTSDDDAVTLALLQRWQVRYVIVGAVERAYIERVCAKPEATCSPARALTKIERLLEPVFTQGGITIYATP